MWPLPLTSFQPSRPAEPQTWQVFCGGYWSFSQAPQCCSTRRFSLTASQNGLLTSSGTGMTFGIGRLHADWKRPGRSRGTLPDDITSVTFDHPPRLLIKPGLDKVFTS